MQDNLTLVQTAYAAFGRGDLPALLAMFDDKIEWRFVGDRDAPFTGTVVGKGQMAEWFGAVAQADDIQAFEPRQFFTGPGHVTVIGWERTIARKTGKVFECDWVHVWSVDGGRITRFYGLLDTQAAGDARGA